MRISGSLSEAPVRMTMFNEKYSESSSRSAIEPLGPGYQPK